MGESKIEMKVDGEIKELKELCDELVSVAKSELKKNPEAIDTHEFKEVCEAIGAIADAKKDTVEACYKKYILKAMEESEDSADDEESRYYRTSHPRSEITGKFIERNYTQPYMPEMYRDMDRDRGMMYYSGDYMSGANMISRNYGNSNADNNRGYKDNMSNRNYNGSGGSMSSMSSGSNSRGYEEGYSDGYDNARKDQHASKYEKELEMYKRVRDDHKGSSSEDINARTQALEKVLTALVAEMRDLSGQMAQSERNVAKLHSKKIVELFS